MDINELFKSFNEEEDLRPRFRDTTEPCDILFVTDTKHQEFGDIMDFSDEAQETFLDLISRIDIKENVSYRVISALKLLGNYDQDDIPTSVIHAHREYLIEEVKAINPKLIIPLGNLAMKVLTKKSGITSKRGCEIHIGDYIAVPTFHPKHVYLEPGLESLFTQDVKNAYDRFIKDRNKFVGSPYVYCDTVKLAYDQICEAIRSSVVSIDLETTGLDFKKDKITTLGCAYGKGKAFVIPMFHKDTPFNSEDLELIIGYIKKLCEYVFVIKVMHNAKFDVKFLKAIGIDCYNVEDTQVIHAMIDENRPHKLIDLVKEEFPEELEFF